MPDHVVQQGECLSSISAMYGLNCKQVWALPQNGELRTKRKNPNILLPGDVLFVPEMQRREEQRSVDHRHKFVKKGDPVRLKLRLLVAGKPIANEPYVLKIGDTELNGSTDGQGMLQTFIPADRDEGTLVLGKEKREFPLRIGHLDPLTEITGIQSRLNNLGFHCGAVDGVLGRITRSALESFQETYQLNITGTPDNPTREKLKSLYGC